MKILAIRIKNLASLEGTTEIDFAQEPLCSAGIFAITGPTGAGKSTILDALCLALYAKTPRYKQAEYNIEIKDVQGSTIKQDDVRSILRDGTAEGFAEVEFAGIDGQHYRATWSVRRSRNKADGKLQQYEITLKNISTNSDIPGKKTELLEEIERLVGLNFEQFTRSVLLAQGDFTAFLKAGKDEKSALLEKLTGTHIYSEISRRIFEKHREQVQQLRELNVQREGIPTLTIEETNGLLAQKKELEAAIRLQEQQVTSLNKEMTWHEQLAGLQSGVEAARLQQEQTIKAREEALPRQRQLQQIIRAQPARNLVDNLHLTQQQYKSKSIQQEQLNKQLTVLQQQKQKLELSVQQTEIHLNKQIQQQEAAQPLLNTAKALDVQLTEKERQVRQAEPELTTVREKQRQQQQLYTQKQQEADHLAETVRQLNQWKEDNAPRQPIAEQQSLILSRLSDASMLLQTTRETSSHISVTEKIIQQNTQGKLHLDKEYAGLQTALQQARKDFDNEQQVLSGIPVHKLELDKGRADAFVEEIIAAEAHWKLLSAALKDREVLLQNLENSKIELQHNREQLITITKLLETTRVQKETSLYMVEKARLAAAESVEHLRSQLRPDEPCPVCGSTTHPYTIQNPQLRYVLTELEERHGQIEETFTQYLTTHGSLQHACNQMQKTIDTLEVEKTTKEENIRELEGTWVKFSIHTACDTQPMAERTAWLLQQLHQQKAQQHQLKEQIQSYYHRRQQIDIQRNQVEQLDKKLSETGNAIKDAERNLLSLQEQLAHHKQEHQKANVALTDVEENLSVYFFSKQWFGHWKADPEAFSQRIRKFAEQWKTNLQRWEESTRQHSILTVTLTAIKEQLLDLSEEANRKAKNLSQLQDEYSQLEKKRKAIFNGEPVTHLEAHFKQTVDHARQELEEHKTKREKLQEEVTRTITQKEQLDADLSILQEQETTLQQNIHQWLVDHNQQNATGITEPELVQLLTFTQEWIETERTVLRTIDDSLTQANSVWNERSSALEKHRQLRSSERSQEELNALLSEAGLALQQKNREHNETCFRLREDERNKQRIGSLLQTIEKQSQVVDNWAKLNEIIGSADGKKFRQIAQEYTLDVLLSYANKHLEMLSKRYVLQRIPQSLGLQVLDQDMGDEVRTVYSLSGGESFLVSLALALGLASLSSSRMKVESLFIDEGFGSLDPATLNIAMDALEHLHNQGRKVGVISHVQEMTERIPVQIKVSKQQSGKSKVEVVGF